MLLVSELADISIDHCDPRTFHALIF